MTIVTKFKLECEVSVFKVNPIDIIDSVVVGTVNQVSREKLVAQAFSSSVTSGNFVHRWKIDELGWF